MTDNDIVAQDATKICNRGRRPFCFVALRQIGDRCPGQVLQFVR
jgi:hypothetical protein